MKKAICSLPFFLWVILICLIFMPGKRETESCMVFLTVVCALGGLWILRCLQGKFIETLHDILTLVLVLLLTWELFCTKLNMAHPVLVPSPENVFQVFVTQRRLMITGIFSSMELLLTGMVLGLTLGVGFGIAAGWIPRLNRMLFPIARVISPIPPIIYTPYVVALMPSFRSASVAVVVLGIFWPAFMNTVLRVTGMEKKLLDSARALCPNTWTMLSRILFPYVWPGIIRNLRVTLSTSFLILTMAEMMGASSGLGYFIKNYSDYANYTNVAAGIILVGAVVSILNMGIGLLERRLIKWK